MKDDLCGVTEYPVAVIVKHPSFHLPKVEPLNSNKDLEKGIKDKDAEQIKDSDQQQQNDDSGNGPGKNVPLNPSGIILGVETFESQRYLHVFRVWKYYSFEIIYYR